EGIERDRQVFVVDDVVVVVAQLGHDPALRMIVPAPRRDVEVLAVEQHPRLGAFGRLVAFARLLHDETAGGGDAAVDLFVQLPVDPQRRVDAHGAYRRAALLVAGDDRGRHGRWRSVVDREQWSLRLA